MTVDCCVKWESHYATLISAFHEMFTKELFADVTLSCEGHKLKAHKVILSACSPFFQDLLEDNNCSHPILVFNGLDFHQLKAVLKFMYYGEVNIAENELPALLKTAEILKIKTVSSSHSNPEKRVHFSNSTRTAQQLSEDERAKRINVVINEDEKDSPGRMDLDLQTSLNPVDIESDLMDVSCECFFCGQKGFSSALAANIHMSSCRKENLSSTRNNNFTTVNSGNTGVTTSTRILPQISTSGMESELQEKPSHQCSFCGKRDFLTGRAVNIHMFTCKKKNELTSIKKNSNVLEDSVESMRTRVGNKKSNALLQQANGSKTTKDQCPFCGKSEFSSIRGAKIHVFYCRSKASPQHENNSRELVKEPIGTQTDNINEDENQTRVCDVCNKTSDNLRTFVVHKITEHGIGTRPTKIPAKPVKEMCNICGQNFDGTWGLFLHRAKTHGISKSSQVRASMKSSRKSKKSLLETDNAESSSTIPENSCGPEESLNLNKTQPTNHGYDGRENTSDLIILNQLQSNPNGETDNETALHPSLDATNKDVGQCTFCGKTGFNTSRAVSVHSYYCQKKRISRKKKKSMNISKKQAFGRVSVLCSGETNESGAEEPIGSTKAICSMCNRIFASPWGLQLHQAKTHSTVLKQVENMSVSSSEPSFAVTQDPNRLQNKQRCNTTFSRIPDTGKMVSNQGERILQQLTDQRVSAQASVDQSVVSCLDSSISQLPDDWVSSNHQTSGHLNEGGITSNVEDVSIKVEVDSVSMFEEIPGGGEGSSEWQKDPDKRMMDEAARSSEMEQNSPLKTCEICSKSFQNFRGVLTHKLRVHQTISLSQHLLGHNSKISKTKKVRRCIFCGKGGFSSGRTAKMHMLFCKKKNLPEPNNRSIMQEPVISESNELHSDGSKEPVLEQTNKSRIDCDICDKQFKNFRGLNIHKARCHGSSVLIQTADLDSQENSYQEKAPQGLDDQVELSVQHCTVPTTKSSASCSEYNLSSSEVPASHEETFGNNEESVENISERDPTNDMLGIIVENEVDSFPAFDGELSLVGKTLCLWQNDLNEEIIGETVAEGEEIPHCSKDDNEEFQRSFNVTYPGDNLIVQNVYSERQLDHSS